MKARIAILVLFFMTACDVNTSIDGTTPSFSLPEVDYLIGNWDFSDAPNATSLADTSALNHSTLLNNMSAANFIVDGSRGQVLSFNSASSQYVEAALNLQSENNFSVSLWMKVDGATSTNPQLIFWQGYAGGNGWGTGTNPGANANEFHISLNYYNACTTGITAYYGSTDAFNTGDCSDRSNAMVADNSTAINDVWNHVVVTVADANSALATLKLYVNGQLMGSETNDETNRSLWNTSVRFSRPDTSSRYFDGDLHMIRVYNKVISEDEILALLNEPLPN